MMVLAPEPVEPTVSLPLARAAKAVRLLKLRSDSSLAFPKVVASVRAFERSLLCVNVP